MVPARSKFRKLHISDKKVPDHINVNKRSDDRDDRLQREANVNLQNLEAYK